MTEKKRTHMETLKEFSIPLIAGVVIAILWANLAPTSYHSVEHTLHFAVNDIFMVFFFALATVEITESCLPGGALNPPRKALNPIFGTLGGVLGPVGVYLLWTYLSGDSTIANGWGIPTATDIALAWLVARMVFGAKHPAVSFLLLLAVADDGIGLGIIAIFYPDPAHPVQPSHLWGVVFAMSMTYAMRKAGAKAVWFYLISGAACWVALYKAGIHPALALVPIVPFMPHSDHDEGLFASSELDSATHTDTLSHFKQALEFPVCIGLFFFGLVNAGVQVSGIGNATWAVMISLIVGKTVGITLFSLVAHRIFGFSLPDGLEPKLLPLVGLVAALGLTVALFVAGVAFTDPVLAGAAKMGALLSVVAAPIAIVIGYILRQKRKKRVLLSGCHILKRPRKINK